MAPAATFHNPGPAYKRILDDLNAHGGIAGRRVTPVWFDVDLASNETFAVQMQAACTRFAQDEPVFAAMGQWLDPFVSCMEQHGGLVISSAGYGFSHRQMFADNPHFLEVSLVTEDAALLQVDSGHRLGVLTPVNRIGVLRLDYPPTEAAVRNVIAPELAARGLELVEDFAVHYFNNLTDAARSRNDVRTAAFRFRDKAIDRVIVFAGTSNLITDFMQDAEMIGFRPTYVVTSANTPRRMTHAPRAQKQGAVGAGWLPNQDVPRPDGLTDGAASSRCRKVLGGDDTYMGACDELWLLKAGVEAARGPINRDTVVTAIERLAPPYESALAGPTRFGPDRHWGVSAFRDLAYTDACDCFLYTSGLRQMQ